MLLLLKRQQEPSPSVSKFDQLCFRFPPWQHQLCNSSQLPRCPLRRILLTHSLPYFSPGFPPQLSLHQKLLQTFPKAQPFARFQQRKHHYFCSSQNHMKCSCCVPHFRCWLSLLPILLLPLPQFPFYQIHAPHPPRPDYRLHFPT